MKVRELIEVMSKIDPEMDVVGNTFNLEFGSSVVDIGYRVFNRQWDGEKYVDSICVTLELITDGTSNYSTGGGE